MNIIAISGHAQAGKDTTANILKRHIAFDGGNVLITHYADLLKYVCRTFFDWNGLKDEHGRHLLQYIGTDVVRAAQPNFWVDFIIMILKLFGDEWDWVIIPDIRFPNEIERLKESGFNVKHVRVDRYIDNGLSAKQKNHASETALDNTRPDYTIANNGSLVDLDRAVCTLLKELTQ